MSLKQKAIKGVIWTILEAWGRRIFSYVVFFTLARILAPEDFGLIALATTVISFANIFVNQGFTKALVQRSELEAEHLDTAFWTNLSLGIIFALITFGSSTAIANIYEQPKLRSIICWLSLTFIIGAFRQVQEAVLTRKLRFKALAIRSISVSFFGGLVGIVAAFSGLGVWSLVIQQLLGETLGVAVLWKASDWTPRFKFSLYHLKELFNFGINLVGISLVNFVTVNADNLLIGYFLGATALGYYALAYKIYDLIVRLLAGTTQTIAFPILSKKQEDTEFVRNAFYNVVEFTSILALPVCVTIILLSPQIITVFLGEEWLPILRTMQILTLLSVYQCLFYFKQIVVISLGKPSWILYKKALEATIDTVLFYFVVRQGIAFVATAYAIRCLLFSPIIIIMMQKLINLNINIYFKKCTKSLIGCFSIVCCLLISQYYIPDSTNLKLELMISCLFSTVAYIMTMFFVAPEYFVRLKGYYRLL